MIQSPSTLISQALEAIRGLRGSRKGESAKPVDLLDQELAVFLRDSRARRDQRDLIRELNVGIAVGIVTVAYGLYIAEQSQVAKVTAGQAWGYFSSYVVPLIALAELVYVVWADRSTAWRQMGFMVLPAIQVSALAFTSYLLPQSIGPSLLLAAMCIIGAGSQVAPFVLEARRRIENRVAFGDPPKDNLWGSIEASRRWLWLDTLLVPMAGWALGLYLALLYALFASDARYRAFVGGPKLVLFIASVCIWAAIGVRPLRYEMLRLDALHEEAVRRPYALAGFPTLRTRVKHWSAALRVRGGPDPSASQPDGEGAARQAEEGD